MAFFTGLLFAPLYGFLSVAEHIAQAAKKELEDPEVIRNKLLELQLAFEMGDIEEREYEAAYQELVQRLQALQGERVDEEE